MLTTSNDPRINYAQVQTGMARSRGLELEGVGHVTDALQLHANYTLNRVETIRSGDSDEIGNRIPLTPLHMASLWANYSFSGPLEGLTVGSGVRYIGSTYGDKTNSKDLKVPAYTLWDAMVRYDISKEWQVQVNASNLTDTNYVSGCNYWCYYGEGRTVTAKSITTGNSIRIKKPALSRLLYFYISTLNKRLQNKNVKAIIMEQRLNAQPLFNQNLTQLA